MWSSPLLVDIQTAADTLEQLKQVKDAGDKYNIASPNKSKQSAFAEAVRMNDLRNGHTPVPYQRIANTIRMDTMCKENNVEEAIKIFHKIVANDLEEQDGGYNVKNYGMVCRLLTLKLELLAKSKPGRADRNFSVDQIRSTICALMNQLNDAWRGYSCSGTCQLLFRNMKKSSRDAPDNSSGHWITAGLQFMTWSHRRRKCLSTGFTLSPKNPSRLWFVQRPRLQLNICAENVPQR